MSGPFLKRAKKAALTCILALALAFGTLPQPGVGASPRMDNRRVVINIPSRTLWLYEGDKIVRYFPVGVGRRGYMTPVGKYRVMRKVLNPGWEQPYLPAGEVRIGPGANNPLGTRWIGFHPYKSGEYGIHGTDNPGSVGKFSSHGCVRMKIPDAEALFDQVDLGTPVEVIYETVLIRPEGNNVRIVVYPDYFGKGMPTAAQVQERILNEFPYAQVDLNTIQAALSKPTQKMVVVGKVAPDEPTAEIPAPFTSRN